ncbi:MAG TPA: ABC transporter ATP-binding protein [Gaiellaceae bacterium]|nr:ABC transporter ATP-binding protein [Gaiellaceae bacterium]
MTGAPPLLVADGVARSFGGRRALAPLRLELRRGEVVGLAGPNGAGKSTLLALLAGALEPTEGQVVRGDGVRVGWVPQRPAHYGRLSAAENLRLFARLEGAPREDADALLRRFDLPEDTRPSAELSVGNRQRLNVALSLLTRPEVLLLDEPSAALDPGRRERLWELVRELGRSGGGVVFATQDLDELDRLADRVLVLRAGECVFEGPAAEWHERAAAFA